jgi:group I intron endonuclease
MNIIIGIYKITSTSGKVYIGQAIDIEKRWNMYRLMHCKNQPKLYRSFKKYGVENHTFEIIKECEVHELNYYERHYQEYYDVLSEFGLNLKYTQTNDRSGKMSEETRKKMSDAKQKMSDETRKKMSESGKNKIFSESHRQKLSDKAKNRKRKTIGYSANGMDGKKHSEETRKKMSDAKKGKKHTDEHKRKNSESNKGRIFSDEHRKKLSDAKSKTKT